jgi:hypothetical protein
MHPADPTHPAVRSLPEVAVRPLHIAFAVLTSMSGALANQITLVPVARQSITQAGGYQQYGHGITAVGYDTSYDIVWRGMMRFDLAALPPGSRVNSAELRMTPTWALYEDWFPFELHRITTAWTPGFATNWTSPWSTPGGDFAPTSASVVTPLGGPTIFTGAGLTADVQGWVDAPAANHGFLVAEPHNWGEAHYGAIELVLDFDPPCAQPVAYCIGAPNSTGRHARIGSTGSTRISDANFALTITGIRPGALGQFFFGTSQQQIPWGDGFLCVGGSLRRLSPILAADAQGATGLRIDFASPAASVITPGSMWNFQFHYRDVAAGGTGFNSSNALQAAFCN